MSDPMDGLSKEERRAKANEMLKAKAKTRRTAPAPTTESRSAAELEKLARELEARERELEERARRLEAAEAEQAEAERHADGQAADATEEVGVAEPGEGAARKPSRREAIRARARRGTKEAARAEEDAAGDDAPTRQAPVRRSNGALLEVTGMSVHYGPIRALSGIDITIEAGEVIALLGANGAGKSSTLKAIAGVVAPSGGDIFFEGESIAGLPAQEVVKRGIALVPEGRELFPTLSVEENLRLGYWPRRSEKAGLRKAYEQVYEMFPRLAERRTQAAGTMSGGEQQMLVFGRALMSSPKLLMADEMSLGLAPLIVRTLFEAIEVIHQAGASVVIVEQFVHQALRHAQRAYVLSKGEVSLSAPSSKLRDDPNLLAAYLGGAEGGVEEVAETPAKGSGAKKKPSAKKSAGPAAKKGSVAKTRTGSKRS